MTITPVLEVQARIAAIQQTISGRAPVAAATGGMTGTFANDLERAVAKQNLSLAAPVSAVVVPASGSAMGANVVSTAKQYLGVPYVWGGKEAATGLDCSGLTSLVYGRLGINLPEGSANQANAGRAVAGLANAQPGDLLFFGQPTEHVAIYAGNGKMVHAPRTGKSVEVSAVYETPTGIRRVLPEQASFASGFAFLAGAGSTTSGTASNTLPALARYAGALPAGTPYATEFRAAEATTGVPARVLAAVAKAESGFRPDAASSAGARGLMQFMPATAAGLNVNPMDPASAIDGAARLLARHVDEFGSLDLSLAAYNSGQGNVRKYGGIPPFAETRQYVQKILTNLNGSSS